MFRNGHRPQPLRGQVTPARLPAQSRAGLEHALTAYRNYRNRARPRFPLRNSLLLFIDFSQPHTARRGYLLDVDANRFVIEPFLVAHGTRIPDGTPSAEVQRLAFGIVNNRVQPIVPRDFSNRPGSNLSSLGFAVTGPVAPSSNWRWRIWLEGCSGPSFNSNLRSRLAYIHPYDQAVIRDSRGNAVAIGASQGCPAVEDAVFEQLRTRIPGGTGVYIYAPTPEITRDPVFLGRDA